MTVPETDPDITTIYNISILPSDFRSLLTIQFKEFVNYLDDAQVTDMRATDANIALLKPALSLAA